MTPEPTVIYQDDDLLVVDKPFGVDSQKLWDQLQQDHEYLGMHHRLDQTASGLLLFTRDTRANAAVAKGFRHHRIQRSYHAVLMGTLTEPATWKSGIERKQATTYATPIGTGGGMSAARLELETGRKHQIRIHAAMAGLPILGDRRYGAEVGRAWARLALHAASLRLVHPRTGAELLLQSPIPADLTEIWRLAGGPG